MNYINIPFSCTHPLWATHITYELHTSLIRYTYPFYFFYLKKIFGLKNCLLFVAEVSASAQLGKFYLRRVENEALALTEAKRTMRRRVKRPEVLMTSSFITITSLPASSYKSSSFWYRISPSMPQGLLELEHYKLQENQGNYRANLPIYSDNEFLDVKEDI